MGECSFSAETDEYRIITNNDRKQYANTMVLSNLPSLERITSTGDWNLNAFGEVTLENIPENIELEIKEHALTMISIIHEDSKRRRTKYSYIEPSNLSILMRKRFVRF